MYDFIHTKRRNRLSTDNIDKLVSLYANAAIEALLQKEADFARMMMEESLSDSSDESQNECDSDNDVMINDTIVYTLLCHVNFALFIGLRKHVK